MKIVPIVAVCLFISLVLAGILYSYAFNLEGSYSFPVIWVACALFCIAYATVKSKFITLSRSGEFVSILLCGMLAGFLAEFLLTGIVGLKGAISGGLIGFGLGLEGLILSGPKEKI